MAKNNISLSPSPHKKNERERQKKEGSPLTGAGKCGEKITVVSAGLPEDGH